MSAPPGASCTGASSATGPAPTGNGSRRCSAVSTRPSTPTSAAAEGRGGGRGTGDGSGRCGTHQLVGVLALRLDARVALVGRVVVRPGAVDALGHLGGPQE